ncbi:amidohydrolase family protein [Oryzifoliimicrobium ureilyticus]|uniref:amidohydrolase family protein n=1 Tax=Oryzifoliimicrobium ureilyticus TaxID=3113724 RepID=UPI0030763F48
MLYDLLIRNVRTETSATLVDIAVKDGLIADIEPNFRCDAVTQTDAEGALAFGGFVESHIHLDKAGIFSRCRICDGTLAEAVRETARAKKEFTTEDVYDRAAKIVQKAISYGTTSMRTFVEVDPRAGLRSFDAILRLKADYAFAIDIDICAFAQEGLTQEPETFALLDQALSQGADLIGGCPYTDPEPRRHIEMIFELARKYDVDVDFHLDFDLNPSVTNLPAVIEETTRNGWGGRVSIGHVTNLSALSAEAVRDVGAQLSAAGIALTVLPATDLFLNGRSYDKLVPRGVAPAHLLAECGVVTSVATNNVSNPFTPYGDASLMRMANLYANVAQLSRSEDLERVFSMVTSSAAKLMRKSYGLSPGNDATIVLLDCASSTDAVREVARAIAGWKNGKQSFWHGRPKLFRP